MTNIAKLLRDHVTTQEQRLNRLEHVDEFLFSIAPGLRKFTWVIVVIFRK